MRHTSRHKLGIGLTFALAATALGGTSVLAFPVPTDKTTAAGTDSVLPPDVGTLLPWRQGAGTDIVVRSPETGLNVRVPAFDSPLAQLDQNDIIVVRSPETGLNVRVPAF